MVLFWGVPKCIEEIVMGLLKKCSSKAPERGGGGGKGKSQADYRHDLGTNLIALSHRKEENTEGELMSTGDAISVRQWLIELSVK